MKLLSVHDLSVSFRGGYHDIPALKGLSFSLDRGECLAVVGESGSGKSTAAKAIMGILEKNAMVASGSILFQGKDLLSMKRKERRGLMGRDMAMVFQNPMTSLNPSYTIYQQLREVFRTHCNPRGSYRDEVLALLKKVELPNPEAVMEQYPFELSGGMRQRISLAMACALKPSLIIADEPTSALDVCTQAELIQLLKRIAKEAGSAIMFITHDLGVVAELADRVLVLYAGERMEEQPVKDFFSTPRHPYARGLLLARPHNFNGRFSVIEGTLKAPAAENLRCAFFDRCREKCPLCAQELPPDVPLPSGGTVRCHLASGKECD